MTEWIGALWPIAVGFITLVIVLARMHYNVESLSEKVKILFDFHNKRNNKWVKKQTNYMVSKTSWLMSL